MSDSSLAEEPVAGIKREPQVLPGMLRQLRLVPVMAAAINILPNRVSTWRAKRKRFRFPLAPAQQIDLGPWQGFGWPAEDLPAARAHFAGLQR